MKYWALLFLAANGGYASAQKITPIPRDTSYNIPKVYSQVRGQYPYVRIVPDSVGPAIQATRNLVYAVLPETPYGRRELHLDIFRPKKTGRYPALLMVHGGGWRSGDKSMEAPMAQLLAAKGFVTIPVEYQLSLEAKYPAAVHNIKAAIRWVRANADRFNIDTSRIAISGTSAGGHLASLVGMTNGRPEFEGTLGERGHSSTIQAMIDIDGVISFIAPMSLNLERKSDSPDAFWLGGTYTERPDRWKEASPATWASAKMGPVLFINSGFSRFHAGQDELIGMMNEWGVYHEVQKINVQVHPFWLLHPWADQTANYMEAFLRKVL